jgi:hypothetical protein
MHPGITFVPVDAPKARWDFIVLWQRGKVPASTRALVEVLREERGGGNLDEETRIKMAEKREKLTNVVFGFLDG